MKAILFAACAGAALVCSCSGSKQQVGAAAVEEVITEVVTPAPAEIMNGGFRVENVVVNDSLSASPAKETPDEPTYANFTGNQYAFKTNCNIIQGGYTLSGDSITLNPGLSTRMACPNMKVEDLLSMIIPQITTVSVENDSTVRLNTSSNGYILMVRSALPEELQAPAE